MSRFLLDVNVLLALLDPQHVFHDAAHAWVERTPTATRLTCPIVQNGVIRVASHASYPNHLGTASAVREVLRAFCSGPMHEFCPDDASLLDDSLIVRPELLTPSLITDVYLLALARRHSARLVTFDRHVPAEAVLDGHDGLDVLEA